jgi:hypothetical protein
MMRAGSIENLFAELHGAEADHLDSVGSVGLLALSSAGVADPQDLQIVKRGSESLAVADFDLASFEQRIVKLDHAAAGGADQVVVVGVTADVLVVVVIFAEVDAAHHARFDEQLERPIDGGAGDLDALLLHFEEQLIGVEVVVNGEDLSDERGSFSGELEALTLEEVLEAIDFALNDGHAAKKS